MKYKVNERVRIISDRTEFGPKAIGVEAVIIDRNLEDGYQLSVDGHQMQWWVNPDEVEALKPVQVVSDSYTVRATDDYGQIVMERYPNADYLNEVKAEVIAYWERYDRPVTVKVYRRVMTEEEV